MREIEGYRVRVRQRLIEEESDRDVELECYDEVCIMWWKSSNIVLEKDSRIDSLMTTNTSMRYNDDIYARF